MGFRLTPQDTSFHELFTASARQLVEGSRTLTTLLGADADERSDVLARMREVEATSHELTRDLVRRIHGSFITPFDRSDMHRLAIAIDHCIDRMAAAVDCIVLYRVEEVLPRVPKQVEIIARMADVTAAAMPRLRTLKDLDSYWVEITRLEHRGNKQYRKMLAELFDSTKAEPLTVMKHKDVIEALEATVNAMEQIALTVEAISVRES